ncbi:hypothetical protein [Paenibacillus alvei]|nr:hypothetical protein [Paenibacillus alvei]
MELQVRLHKEQLFQLHIVAAFQLSSSKRSYLRVLPRDIVTQQAGDIVT